MLHYHTIHYYDNKWYLALPTAEGEIAGSSIKSYVVVLPSHSQSMVCSLHVKPLLLLPLLFRLLSASTTTEYTTASYACFCQTLFGNLREKLSGILHPHIRQILGGEMASLLMNLEIYHVHQTLQPVPRLRSSQYGLKHDARE